MSSLQTLAYGLLGNSSEIVVAAAFLFTIIVGCVFTYLFGFNASSNNSNDQDDTSSSSTNEEKKSKEKKISSKKSTTTTTTTNTVNLKKDETSKASVKKTTTKLSPAPTSNVEANTTATNKSKKSSPPGKVAKETAQTKTSQVKAAAVVSQPPVNSTEALSAEDGWITVVDKKQKKSPSLTEINGAAQATVITAASAVPVATSPKNAKKKENSNNSNKQVQQTAKVVEPIEPESEIVQEATSNDDQEDDWIPANSKVSKKVSIFFVYIEL